MKWRYRCHDSYKHLPASGEVPRKIVCPAILFGSSGGAQLTTSKLKCFPDKASFRSHFYNPGKYVQVSSRSPLGRAAPVRRSIAEDLGRKWLVNLNIPLNKCFLTTNLCIRVQKHIRLLKESIVPRKRLKTKSCPKELLWPFVGPNLTKLFDLLARIVDAVLSPNQENVWRNFGLWVFAKPLMSQGGNYGKTKNGVLVFAKCSLSGAHFIPIGVPNIILPFGYFYKIYSGLLVRSGDAEANGMCDRAYSPRSCIWVPNSRNYPLWVRTSCQCFGASYRPDQRKRAGKEYTESEPNEIKGSNNRGC
ncbi:hypothetical protein DOY81_011637 [Sarcophaga bullata]|nr:hypothetical protein DOY81_011637 [Sarcophaga bullata]